MKLSSIMQVAMLIVAFAIVVVIANVSSSYLEYMMTIGILIAFAGLFISVILSRKEIIEEFKSIKLKKAHIAIAIAILLIFLSIELVIVQPEQYLFFDNIAYQVMAVSLLHTGQAWGCAYGTPTYCFVKQVYLQPVGEAFDLAPGFLLFGISRNVAFNVQILLSCIAVLMTFFVALLLFRDIKAAMFSELLIALSPTLLIWARSITADLPFLTYSLVVVFFFLLLVKRKNQKCLAMLAFSAVLVAYIKAEAVLLLAVLFIAYFIFSYSGVSSTLKESRKAIKAFFNERSAVPLILILFIIAITPELYYLATQPVSVYLNPGEAINDSCGNLPQLTATNSTFGTQFFGYNVCADVYFWFNVYQNQFIMQPVAFTLLAILGAICMFAFRKRRELLLLTLWFITFFVLYTTFYDGAATWGTNWRFQLGLIAPASLLGGFACATLINAATKISGEMAKKGKKPKSAKALWIIALAELLFVIFISIYLLVPTLGLSFTNNPYGGSAFYDENFIINESHVIPSDCVVYSYDPGLFMLVNRSAIQIGYLYNSTMYFQNVSERFPCKVVDYGFWCPGNVGG